MNCSVIVGHVNCFCYRNGKHHPHHFPCLIFPLQQWTLNSEPLCAIKNSPIQNIPFVNSNLTQKCVSRLKVMVIEVVDVARNQVRKWNLPIGVERDARQEKVNAPSVSQVSNNLLVSWWRSVWCIGRLATRDHGAEDRKQKGYAFCHQKPDCRRWVWIFIRAWQCVLIINNDDESASQWWAEKIWNNYYSG